MVTKLGLDRDKDFRRYPSLLARARTAIGLVNAPSGKPDRFREAIGLILDGLLVKRTGLSYAIDISFSFPDAFRTSEIANTVAEAYITDQIENRSQAARVGGDWLQDRMGSLRAQMNGASEAVQVFRASHNYSIAKSGPSGGNTVPAPATAPVEDKTLDELEAEASTYRRIYESFLQSYTESVQRQSFPVSDARILTSATMPTTKSTPRTLLIYALAGLLGGLLGSGIALLRHRMDQAVRSPFQITAACALADLGSLPRMRAGLAIKAARALTSGRATAPASPPTSAPSSTTGTARSPAVRGPYLFTRIEQRDAAFGRALKGARTMLDIAGRHDAIRYLGVTSTHAGAGSSTLAGNLASLAAAGGTRTLLVDADMDRRTLTRQVGRAASFGLADVLAQAASIDQAIVRLEGTSLDFMPGTIDKSRSRDLSPKRLDLLLKELTGRYDLVVLDLPPLLPVGETLDLSGCLDGIVLAVEWGRTRADQVVEGATYLARAYARPLGFIINKAEA